MKGIQHKMLLTLLLVMSISIIYLGYIALKDNNLSPTLIVRDDGSSYTTWNTGNVTDMHWIFNSAGINATYILDLSKWDVSKVSNYDLFNIGVSTKVIAPTWVTTTA